MGFEVAAVRVVNINWVGFCIEGCGEDSVFFHFANIGFAGAKVRHFKTADVVEEIRIPYDVVKTLHASPVKAFRGKTDFMFVFAGRSEGENMKPNFKLLAEMGGRGVIVTAPGVTVDFVSRFFAPQTGINEDPVTGSAHTTLTPYWSATLGRKKLKALQVSERGGELICEDLGDRVKIAGKAVTYMEGELFI